MIQEILVYIIGIGAVGYIFWRIFRKEKDPCNGCTACSKGEKREECAKTRRDGARPVSTKSHI